MDFPWQVPYIPGDVTNATTYDYPVLIKTYNAVDLNCVACGDPGQADNVVAAAVDMAAEGVPGISGDCGFLINYRAEITRAVDVPVLVSSLQLLPLVEAVLGGDQSIAILTPFPERLDEELLAKTGYRGSHTIIPVGLDGCPEFNDKLMQPSDCVDSDKVEAEMAALALEVQREHPQLGAFLLECSMLPPYSAAIHAATGLPVFDYVNMINLLKRATHQSEYRGYY